EAEPAEQAHVQVGDPYQGEPGDEIAAPAGVEEGKAGHDQRGDRDVVAETVLAGEEIKVFFPGQARSAPALLRAPLSRIAENLFMGNGPADTGDGNRQDDSGQELRTERHVEPVPHGKIGAGLLPRTGEIVV